VYLYTSKYIYTFISCVYIYRKLLKQEMEVAQEGQDKNLFSNVTKALAQRWVTMARAGIDSRFRARSEELRIESELVMKSMPEEDDWYFGSALRLEGVDLQVCMYMYINDYIVYINTYRCM
jgi:hypothetical protein